MDYQTGFHQPLQFQASLFKPIFNNHMATLKQIKNGGVASYHIIMSTIYDVARWVEIVQFFFLMLNGWLSLVERRPYRLPCVQGRAR